jgi:ABC-type bacteriocin/lantibiotic exporter with double-glycine peptidase domain
MTTEPRAIFRLEALASLAKRREDAAAAATTRSNPARFGSRLRRRLRRRPRVPVILQLNAVECGLACLAMVLSYFGRQTTLSECRRLTSAGRDGISAGALVKLAKAFGLRARGLSVAIDGLATLGQPVIAHWGFDHFVVVEWIAQDLVGIVDPGRGRREVSHDEFSRQYTGVILFLEPGEDFQCQVVRACAPWRSYVMTLLRTSRRALVQILGASLALQLFGLALPVLTKVVVDALLTTASMDVMPLFGLGIVVWVAAFTATTHLRTVLLIELQARLDTHLMQEFFAHLLRLPYRFFQQRATGDLLARLHSNTDIRDALTGQTVTLLLDSGLVIVYLGILLTQESRLALWTLALGGIQLSLVLASARPINNVAQRELTAEGSSQSFLVEALKGIATIKITGCEGAVYAYWSRLFQHTLCLSVERSRLTGCVDTWLAAMRLLAPLTLLWVGAGGVSAGTLTPGTMLALTTLASLVLFPLTSLAANVQKLQLVGAHLDRLADVLQASPEQETLAVCRVPPWRGHIELCDVSFRYDDQGPLVLHNITLCIEPGQKVALVGRSGSGKTTLAMLLLGLYEPTAGEIRFDGIPASAINLRELRQHFGVVLQEPYLFAGSIYDNITLGAPTAVPEDVVRAAQLAAIHDDIVRMPMQYHTRLAEGNGGLSGGQRQRLAIARALVHKPAMLLFDEATSHLDTLTEHQVDTNLSQLHYTRVVIAHRLSTIRNADQIIVLDHGEVVERGTHDELLARGAHYSHLVHGAVLSGTASQP